MGLHSFSMSSSSIDKREAIGRLRSLTEDARVRGDCLYEMLGRPPGISPTDTETCLELLAESAIAIRTLLAGLLPAGIKELCRRRGLMMWGNSADLLQR